jgi:predicted permease
MLFTSFSAIEVTPRLLANSFQALLLLSLQCFSCFSPDGLQHVSTGSKGGMHRYSAAQHAGNIIYLGLPVIAAQFGQEGLLYGRIFRAGIKHNDVDARGGYHITREIIEHKVRLGRIFNINTIAIITGFLLFLLSIKLPKFVLILSGRWERPTPTVNDIHCHGDLFCRRPEDDP